VTQSPELAGGAGFTFQDIVTAYYLTELLREGFAPGIDSRTVCRVAMQQRDFGEPLDDLIVDFRALNGTLARLSLAREGAGRSRIFDRPAIVRELSTKIRLTVARSLRADLQRISELSSQWLQDITESVGGTCIERPTLLTRLETKLASSSRIVQIRGLPGSGKSVLLRRRVEAELNNGPVLLLKSGRLEGTSWANFSTANGLSSAPLVDLLVEMAAIGSRTLYIDGIDRIEKDHQPIIRDLVRTILSSSVLDDWKIVISLRDSGIEPLRNWMGDLIGTLSIETVEVGILDEDEAEELAKAKPHLRALLFGNQAVREIVRRPFFAKVLDQNFGTNGADLAFQPQSEVDLIDNWWARGGYSRAKLRNTLS
jgi:hypothetical protein